MWDLGLELSLKIIENFHGLLYVQSMHKTIYGIIAWYFNGSAELQKVDKM